MTYSTPDLTRVNNPAKSTKRTVLLVAAGVLAFLLASSLVVQFSGAILTIAWYVLYATFFVSVGYGAHAYRISKKESERSLPPM